jgi:hypothetical protein
MPREKKDKCLVPDYYTLILAVSVHVRVTVIADSEYVRRQLADFTILVQFDLLRGINRQYLIRIDGDQDGARVRLQNDIVTFMRVHRIQAPAFCLHLVAFQPSVIFEYEEYQY